MICVLHGYLLEGSGSNLWTRYIVKSLCKDGETVHLVCEEAHPEEYDFIAEAYSYSKDGKIEVLLKRDVPYKGRCIMHRPELGDTLPVYVWDKYEKFSKVIPMIELPDDEINDYLDRNTKVVTHVVQKFGITTIHVNHAVLMSVVAQRVSAKTSVPFAIMAHGSAIEFAVKKDKRFLELATGAFEAAKKIFVVGGEMRKRVKETFPSVPQLDYKMIELNLGVDTSLFDLVNRESRPESILKLEAQLREMPRGKTTAQSQSMRDGLSGEIGKEKLQKLFASASSYDARNPDADLEFKLNSVDWKSDKIILFVGRIISSKGLQPIIAALPNILARHPSARLVVVGHGPLREPMEALLWALENGKRDLVRRIASWGRSLEGSTGSFDEVLSFYDQLEKKAEIDVYYNNATKYLSTERVIFTGYLTHQELRYLFPCCDVAVFPSIVAEAGPLVFLEALSSGCFPLGTYFGGMTVNIDLVSAVLPKNDVDLMKIRAKNDYLVSDIADKVSAALEVGDKHKETLRKFAKERYDWQTKSRKISYVLHSLAK